MTVESLTTYEAIGENLQRAREMHGVSLDRAAYVLHIRRRYLAALERGDFGALPGLAYVKGYLQRYGQFLELDADALINAFEHIGAYPQRRFFVLPDVLGASQDPHSLLVLFSLASTLTLVFISALYMVYSHPNTALVKPVPPEIVVPTRTVIACQMSGNHHFPPCYWPPEQLKPPIVSLRK